jgi:hypothetical protein
MKILDQDSAGNWKEADNFVWHGSPDDADDRALVYTLTRDSDILDKCNAEIIAEAMKPFIEDGSVTSEFHHHWACGWIEGYSIVILQSGILTPAAEKWNELAERMNSYPVLDDSAYSQAIDDAIQNLSEYDCRCIAEDRLKIREASEMDEEEIRALEGFYEAAMEWVEE